MGRDDVEQSLLELHPQSYGWALSCSGWDPSEAEEVLQTAYLKIVTGSARFEARSTFKTWVFAVIRKTAAGRRRSARRVATLPARWFANRPAAPVAPDPESRLAGFEASQILRRALAGLAPRAAGGPAPRLLSRPDNRRGRRRDGNLGRHRSRPLRAGKDAAARSASRELTRMSRHDGDSELREIFQAARREAERRAPPFERMWRDASRGSPPARRWVPRLATAGAALLLAAAGFVALRSSRPASLSAEDIAALETIERWQAPTDFLNDVPLLDILDSVPSLGQESRLIREEPGVTH